jgi:hypothetical protein
VIGVEEAVETILSETRVATGGSSGSAFPSMIDPPQSRVWF